MIVFWVEVSRNIGRNLLHFVPCFSHVTFINVKPLSSVTILAKARDHFLQITSVILREFLRTVAFALR